MRQKEEAMNNEQEAVYRSMRFSAVVNIVLGVLVLVTGVVSGALLLVSAGKLLNGKSHILF